MMGEANTAADLEQPSPADARQLVWFADAFEKARRNRTGTGERIGAVVRGPDATAGAGAELTDVDALLVQIRDGHTDGPIPLLGRTYRRQWALEQQMWRALIKRLQAHPAGGWLQQVRGVDPTTLARLLARLDPARASTPSSFWAYCGFATVPGVEYRCAECGFVAAAPVTAPPPVSHLRLGGRTACRGVLHRARGPEQGVRVAQPKAIEGGRAEYDRTAKSLCYQIGTDLLQADGAYARFYREERFKLDRERREWPSPRKHMTALRKMEKLFLSHLWLVWRESLGLPLTQPYAPGGAADAAVIPPWQMVDGSIHGPHAAVRLTRSAPLPPVESPTGATEEVA